MSYDYMLCKPIWVDGDIDWSNLVPLGTVEEVKEQLTALFPAIRWYHHEVPDELKLPGSSGEWEQGVLNTDEDYAEFSIHGSRNKIVDTLTVATSYRSDDTDFILELCAATSYVAFDVQVGEIVRESG